MASGSDRYRKEKRYFKPCDVARIVQNCIDDSNGAVTRSIMIAVVARQLGYEYVAVGNDVITEEVSNQSQLVSMLESIRDLLDDFLRRIGLDV